jgi:hypothetical protein
MKPIITKLQMQGVLVTVPAATEYQCDGGHYDYLTAFFCRNAALPIVVVLTRNTSRDSNQVIA